MTIALREKLKGHSGALYAVSTGRHPGAVFTGGADNVVAEWDYDGKTPNHFAIRTTSTIYSLLALNSILVIGTAKGEINVIDTEAKTEIRCLQLHNKGIFDLKASPEGNIYACSGDGSVSVWNPKDWSLLYHFHVSTEKIRRIAFDQHSNRGAIACNDGRCIVFSTSDMKILHEFDAHQLGCTAVAFQADGSLLTGGKDAHLKHWILNDSIHLNSDIPAHNYVIYDIVPILENSFATASRDKTIKIWDADIRVKPIRISRPAFDGHTHSINRIMWLEEHSELISCSDDRTIIRWKLDSDEMIQKAS